MREVIREGREGKEELELWNSMPHFLLLKCEFEGDERIPSETQMDDDVFFFYTT